MGAIEEIKRFQIERNLVHQNYNWQLEATNIIEELLEARGYGFINKHALSKFIDETMIAILEGRRIIADRKEPTADDIADAFSDIIVFSIGALMKAGYDPECTLAEVAKEINSRQQDPEQKKQYPQGVPQGIKWMKDKNQDPVTLYKANFLECKKENQ
jgi:hypothetical protein